MTYIDPWKLTKESRAALLVWLKGEGLEPSRISQNRFSVHKGIISGYEFISDTRPKYKTHFRVAQKHALPELKEL